MRVCIACGVGFTHETRGKRGRPPAGCPGCRENGAARKAIKQRENARRNPRIRDEKDSTARGRARLLNNRRARLKKRAIEAGIPFNLTHSEMRELLQCRVCPVLDIPLDSSSFGNRPSVDRIDPHLGYVVGNVRIISNRANTLRSNATLREMVLVLRNELELRSVADTEALRLAIANFLEA